MKKILSIALLAILTMGVANAQSADAIAKKYVEAIGGAAKWKALKSRKMTVTLNQQGFDIPGYIVGDASNRQRLELEFSGMKMIQASDGKTAWGMNGFMGETAPKKLEGDQAAAMEDEVFLDEFIDYKKRGYAIELVGEADIDGKSCHKIKLTKKSGNETTYYFDKDSGLMLAEEGVTAGQTMMSVYSDHTEVEGLMMPMKITQKQGGATLFTITTTKTELNIATTDDMFAFPGN